MSTLTKSGIIQALNEDLGFNKREASELVSQLLEVVASSLEREEQVKIAEFGKFLVLDKRARPGCNPRTGEQVTVSARKVVTFRPSRAFKKKLNS